MFVVHINHDNVIEYKIALCCKYLSKHSLFALMNLFRSNEKKKQVALLSSQLTIFIKMNMASRI